MTEQIPSEETVLFLIREIDVTIEQKTRRKRELQKFLEDIQKVADPAGLSGLEFTPSKFNDGGVYTFPEGSRLGA